MAIICFSIAFPFVFLVVPKYSGTTEVFFLIKILFLSLSFISGFLTGSQFPLANILYLKKSSNLSQTAGLLYASDLLGGWFGGIVGAVLLLPVLGLTDTCLTVGLLKLISFTVINNRHDRNLFGREK
jgi:spermidine synthase